ncbi:MAG: biopolymer transporter ExbD [Parvibaculum sp.]|uniref:ExbD/TolR family protein n=1 Tax=Parvibaculum sp. TaxID=2024848 RepID=UPI0025DA0C95|nr:biopolymer transporter ExbD [Parvibaculum sp.]MCE9650473.1 biopolymer transporter ExbD [Parvibaculum sp.]
MAISIGGGEEDEVLSAINTTPLVDVMLVLLIIFLITIPVAIQTVPVTLPKASNVATQTKPENIILAVDREGDVFWNSEKMIDNRELLARIKSVATTVPQPEIHVRGDKDARFEFIGRVIVDCQRGGIRKVAFITEPNGRAEQ